MWGDNTGILSLRIRYLIRPFDSHIASSSREDTTIEDS